MRTTTPNRFRELIVGLGSVVVALFAVVAIVWVNIGHLETASAADREAREELAEADAVIEALVDRETGLRGYLITRDPAFLKPYREADRRLDGALDRLVRAAQDDPPELRARVENIVVLANSWDRQVVRPQVSSVGATAEAPPTEAVGKQHMDRIREDIAVLRQAEGELLAQRARVQAQAFVTSRLTLLAGSAAALAFALFFGGRSFWRAIADRRTAEAASRVLQDALARAHAAESAKTLFLSNMSHEMRTPLNGVTGMADALSGSRLEPAQREQLDIIRSCAATLNGLIGDLLALARGDHQTGAPPPSTTFELGDLVMAAGAGHRASALAKGLGFDARIDDQAAVTVFGDPARLSQILSCLLSNAVKFTDSGQVSLSVRALGPDRYRFEVSDTGVGFDPTHKAELFETFVQADAAATRRHGGAGLGLAVVRRLAADIGARIDCRSTVGHGSIFTLDVDLQTIAPTRLAPTPAAPAIMVETAPDEPAAAEPMRVLIVDDNATNRKVLELILEQLGVETRSVENGQLAVEAATHGAFSAILMDIQMPVMDGLTATREIRRLEHEAGKPATPVIIVSANGQPEHIEAGRAAGAQLHLAKPVAATALVEALNAVLADHERKAA